MLRISPRLRLSPGRKGCHSLFVCCMDYAQVNISYAPSEQPQQLTLSSHPSVPCDRVQPVRNHSVHFVFCSELAPSNLLIISIDDLIFLSDLNSHQTHQIQSPFLYADYKSSSHYNSSPVPRRCKRENGTLKFPKSLKAALH